MKSIMESINEAFVQKFMISQADANNNAAYTTIDTDETMRDYKYGFLSYSQYNKAILLVAFNKVEDLQDLLETDDDEYSDLLSMKPQDTKTIRGELFVKLW